MRLLCVFLKLPSTQTLAQGLERRVLEHAPLLPLALNSRRGSCAARRRPPRRHWRAFSPRAAARGHAPRRPPPLQPRRPRPTSRPPRCSASIQRRPRRSTRLALRGRLLAGGAPRHDRRRWRGHLLVVGRQRHPSQRKKNVAPSSMQTFSLLFDLFHTFSFTATPSLPFFTFSTSL